MGAGGGIRRTTGRLPRDPEGSATEKFRSFVRPSRQPTQRPRRCRRAYANPRANASGRRNRNTIGGGRVRFVNFLRFRARAPVRISRSTDGRGDAKNFDRTFRGRANHPDRTTSRSRFRFCTSTDRRTHVVRVVFVPSYFYSRPGNGLNTPAGRYTGVPYRGTRVTPPSIIRRSCL